MSHICKCCSKDTCIKVQLYKPLFQRYVHCMLCLHSPTQVSSLNFSVGACFKIWWQSPCTTVFILASYHRSYQANSRLDCQVSSTNKQGKKQTNKQTSKQTNKQTSKKTHIKTKAQPPSPGFTDFLGMLSVDYTHLILPVALTLSYHI